MGAVKLKTAIVCAWRKGEMDLDATLQSAGESLGKGIVIPCEDRTAEGPGRTRHRGIEAAQDADVIIIIDAHMRFQGDVLKRIAGLARREGGLWCPLCHHNERCTFDGAPYAGARIVYRAKDPNKREQYALAAKWSKDPNPGPRGCVMGACYAFRRDWYYQMGQPLAALPGWGCDEEALSISAWLSGAQPTLMDGHVAHLYRTVHPWQRAPDEHARVNASRMALIHAVVSEANARSELETWQRAWVPEGVPACTSPEAERWRLALLRQPRKWHDWRAQVCEPDDIDGHQQKPPATEAPRATRVPNPVIPLGSRPCPHCNAPLDPRKVSITHTFDNGNTRHICPFCANPFIWKLYCATAQ